jgi:hypothetical protein
VYEFRARNVNYCTGLARAGRLVYEFDPEHELSWFIWGQDSSFRLYLHGIDVDLRLIKPT